MGIIFNLNAQVSHSEPFLASVGRSAGDYNLIPTSLSYLSTKVNSWRYSWSGHFVVL